MRHASYLILLCTSLLCLGIVDYRYRLALFEDARRAGLTLLTGIIFFLIWDCVGIRLGIFFIGATDYLTGITILPDLPLEEIFFLALLNYSALLVWLGGGRIWRRT